MGSIISSKVNKSEMSPRPCYALISKRHPTPFHSSRPGSVRSCSYWILLIQWYTACNRET